MAKSFRESVLRDRLAWLERQVESTKRALQPFEVDRTDLFGSQPATLRKLSQQQCDYAEYSATRCTRLEEIGVDPVEERMPAIAFINVKMKTVRERCAALATSTRSADDVLEQLFDAFFALDWPAKMEPPYPWSCFASDEKGWGPLLEQLKRSPAAATR